MMKKLLLAVWVLAAISSPTWGRTIEEQVLASLEGQGYVILEQGYTFLGRLRIVAENGMYHREIVVNPGTGEILRDYAVTLPQGLALANPQSSGGKAAVASAAGGVAGVASGDTSNPVTMSLGTGRADGPGLATGAGANMQPMGVVLPESLFQMDLGAP